MPTETDVTLFDSAIAHEPLALEGMALLTFDPLNRSDDPAAGRVRTLLEEFFTDYPKPHKVDLRHRFRSKKRDKHAGAFFELVLHATLCRLGCAVKLNPAPSQSVTTKPDFLAKPGDASSQFYVEARVATGETTEDAKLRDAMDLLYTRLENIKSPDFFINTIIRHEGGAPVPAAKMMMGFLRSKLRHYTWDQAQRDLAEGGLQAMPRWIFTEGEWTIEFMPQPKSTERRGSAGVKPIGFRMEALAWIDPKIDIRTALEKKASKYGTLDLPFIVGINVLEDCDEKLDAMPAFYGTENFVFNPATDQAEAQGMLRDGTWMGPNGPRNQNVSAVLLCSPIHPWNLATAPVRLWHHPFAARPYSSVLTVFPQAVWKVGVFNLIPGRTLGEVLGLSATWPR